jgi:arginyl-tRNA synthetase
MARPPAGPARIEHGGRIPERAAVEGMHAVNPIRLEAHDLTAALRAAIAPAILAWSGKSATELGFDANPELFGPVRPPRPEMGDFAIPCFALAKPLRRSPAEIATALAPVITAALTAGAQPEPRAGSMPAGRDPLPALARIETAGPYVNLFLDPGSLAVWITTRIAAGDPPYGAPLPATGRRTLVEYSAPNSNKPLHLGHVRNNLLGLSLCNLLAAAGEEVIPVNLVNDRGIQIAKSMVAYQRWGAGETPQGTGRKGDHFVGDFYVRFGRELKAQAAALAGERGVDLGTLDDDARRALEDETEIMAAARESLRRWEEGDPETRALWETMNGWVYAGFDRTYARLGCTFRRWYLESETYKPGKALVDEGLARGIFRRAADGSVWAPLEEHAPESGLKDKLLLRSDGTSVYMTQDLGTALRKYEDFHMARSIYVVGREQIHHFRVLFTLLRMLGFEWAAGCHHLSYGLIELPHNLGKLKSREGRAVDADDLLDELAELAQRKTRAGGFATEASVDLAALGDAIGQGALKMYLLQVGAEKNIVFDPDATIEFEGDTGPAVQYSHARICSIARKALAEGKLAPEDLCVIELPEPFAGLGTGAPGSAAAAPAGARPLDAPAPPPTADAAPHAGLIRRAAGLRAERAHAAMLDAPDEKALCLELARFPSAIAAATEQLSPSPLAAYLLDLTKSYARFYHNCPVLRAETTERMRARLHLSLAVAATLRRGLSILGIRAPDAM